VKLITHIMEGMLGLSLLAGCGPAPGSHPAPNPVPAYGAVGRSIPAGADGHGG
jgi:hypothetical protein